MTAPYELLTVLQVAELLYKSEQGVRRLIQAGKLEAIRERGRYLVRPESLAAYIARLSHPPVVMSAMHDARHILYTHRLLNARHGLSYAHPAALTMRADPYALHFIPKAAPVARALLDALKVRDYARVEEYAHELWRVWSDYEMLHAPSTPSRKARGPEWSTQPLFPGLAGGGA